SSDARQRFERALHFAGGGVERDFSRRFAAVADRERATPGVDGDPLDLVALDAADAEASRNLRAHQRVGKAALTRRWLQCRVFAESALGVTDARRDGRAVRALQGFDHYGHALAGHEVVTYLRFGGCTRGRAHGKGRRR